MALFKPVRRTAAALSAVEKKDGQFLIATDTGAAFVDVSDSERLQLMGGITPFTFVVDSDEALAAWANNAAGNDYTSVLIRAGEWTSDKEVNLTTAWTKVVVGMPGSLLKFTSQYGLKYDSIPTTVDYWMWGVNVDINYTETVSSIGVCYGFYNCTNLTNCTGNCTGNGPTISGSNTFSKCTYLTNCAGTGTGKSFGYGFSDCRVMLFCKPGGTSTSTTYTVCYMHDSGTTDPVADTAAGGWNRS